MKKNYLLGLFLFGFAVWYLLIRKSKTTTGNTPINSAPGLTSIPAEYVTSDELETAIANKADVTKSNTFSKTATFTDTVMVNRLVGIGGSVSVVPGSGLGPGGWATLLDSSNDVRGRLRLGVVQTGSPGGNQIAATVTFAKPMPDENYIVLISPASPAAAEVQSFYSDDKTVNGFNVRINQQGLNGPNAWILEYLIVH